MALSKERIGELALVVLLDKLEKDGGIRLNPKEVRRDIANSAKSMSIPTLEMAQFVEVLVKAAYERTVTAIGSMTAGPKGE